MGNNLKKKKKKQKEYFKMKIVEWTINSMNNKKGIKLILKCMQV